MRALTVLALLALATPLAAADPAPLLRACSSLGCAIVKDSDGDGGYDWANAAFFVMEQGTLNANYDRNVVLWEAVVSTDELGGAAGATVVHEAEEATGEEVRVATLAAVGEADLRAPDGSPGFRFADALVTLQLIDHEDGSSETVYWRYARVVDNNGDNVPDAVETSPGLP